MSHSLLQIGAAGMQSGLKQAEKASAEIADALNNDDVSLITSSIDLLQAENQVKASAQVVKTADQLLGSIIDTMV
ncbi:MAG: hypothetical protein P8I62_01580 [Pseudomonadales bacterium]|nr:hypothetical protein [Pseudomonadales bacterium]